MTEEHEGPPTTETEPEESGDTGSEGNAGSPDADTMPAAPSGDDDSELGDTDQHSEA